MKRLLVLDQPASGGPLAQPNAATAAAQPSTAAFWPPSAARCAHFGAGSQLLSSVDRERRRRLSSRVQPPDNHDRRSRRKSGSRRRGHHGAHETLDGIKHPPLQYPDLSDELVRLRPLADTDADALVKACADPLIPKFTYWPNALSKEDARERVHHAEEWRTAGTRLELAVADTASDALIGFIGLAPAWQERRASVFYWTAPWARERGVARRALKLLVHWAFDELSIERLELEADADNIASQRVAEAVGFERERVLRAHRLRADGRCDSIIYSLAA
jgi:RimJ/RimL family protein N-acetyltransferase